MSECPGHHKYVVQSVLYCAHGFGEELIQLKTGRIKLDFLKGTVIVFTVGFKGAFMW